MSALSEANDRTSATHQRYESAMRTLAYDRANRWRKKYGTPMAGEQVAEKRERIKELASGPLSSGERWSQRLARPRRGAAADDRQPEGPVRRRRGSRVHQPWPWWQPQAALLVEGRRVAVKRRATHRLPVPAPNALPIREWPLIDGAYIVEWTDQTWTVNREETK